MKVNLQHKTIETFHFSSALNVIMILLIFIMIVFAAYFKNGIQIKIYGSPFEKSGDSVLNMFVIDEMDNLYYKAERITIADVSAKIKRMSIVKHASIVIRPNSATKLNVLENVISAVKNAGIKNIILQTDPVLF